MVFVIWVGLVAALYWVSKLIIKCCNFSQMFNGEE